MIKEVITNQDARKEEVSSKLKEFQKEQQEMARGLKALLAKGRSLRIKDLKEMLQEFRTQHKERLTHQVERTKEVNKILGRTKDRTPEAINIDVERDSRVEEEVEKFNKISKRRG